MDKIYSRRRIKLPNFKYKPNKRKQIENKNILKMINITCVISIAIITAYSIIKAISPVINKQCINTAKSIATKISNEQATIVMSKYKYDDLCTVTKDKNRKYCYD